MLRTCTPVRRSFFFGRDGRAALQQHFLHDTCNAFRDVPKPFICASITFVSETLPLF
jgi:hypothetical protein